MESSDPNEWQYHQDTRDMAAGVGFVAIVCIMVIATMVFSIVMSSHNKRPVMPAETVEESRVQNGD